MTPRIAVLPRAARLQVTIAQARRRERRLFDRIGQQLAQAELAGRSPEAARVGAELAAVAEALRAAEARSAESLEQDRADYAVASSWVKPLVIARGLLARRVSGAQARRLRARLRPLQRAAGAHLLAGELASA